MLLNFHVYFSFLAPTGALKEGILCVRACICDIIQITVKMSSSSNLKSPGVKQCKQASMQASMHASKQERKKERKKESKQASKQAGKQACKP